MASVVEKCRVATGPGSAAHQAALAVMPILKQWGNRYLQSMTPSGGYAKGTAISLASHIDILILLRHAPEIAMRRLLFGRRGPAAAFRRAADHRSIW